MGVGDLGGENNQLNTNTTAFFSSASGEMMISVRNPKVSQFFLRGELNHGYIFFSTSRASVIILDWYPTHRNLHRDRSLDGTSCDTTTIVATFPHSLVHY